MTKLAPQEIRTFFISSRTAASAPIFRRQDLAELFVQVILENKKQGRMLVHEFVIMHDHFHALLTPAYGHPLEKCMQFLKGGFSFRAKRELGFQSDVWQAGFNEHRVKDSDEYVHHAEYIRRNPVKAGYVLNPADYRFCSAHARFTLDPPPEHLLG